MPLALMLAVAAPPRPWQPMALWWAMAAVDLGLAVVALRQELARRRAGTPRGPEWTLAECVALGLAFGLAGGIPQCFP